jgi:hypothetical protein
MPAPEGFNGTVCVCGIIERLNAGRRRAGANGVRVLAKPTLRRAACRLGTTARGRAVRAQPKVSLSDFDRAALSLPPSTIRWYPSYLRPGRQSYTFARPGRLPCVQQSTGRRTSKHRPHL